jgi:CHAT domain-containing protein
LASLGDSDVIHIAAHAKVTDNRTEVLLTSALSSHDVAVKQVRRGGIAVLAGCRTGHRPADSDLSSLAFAFLGAGSRSAVGTLWDVEDNAARVFSRHLHRSLTAGMEVATAVRHAQLELRRLGLPARTWGAFQAYGGG